uniref:Uncharacterized protein n=1 Tax=Quercus lobata TaxID=97700 RepID=A0A7N2M219_QUELO
MDRAKLDNRRRTWSVKKAVYLYGDRLMKSITAELEAAKKELSVVREKGFQFMSSMDIIRNKLKRVTKETVWLKKIEVNPDLTVQNHNSKLLRVKSKLEAKKKELNTAKTATIKANIEKTEFEIKLTEERLEAAMQELEYLTGRAVRAEGTADKKVATAHVWIEALKASEKEILMKTELAQREIREKCKKNAEAENLQLELHRKSMKGNGNFTPSRRAKFQNSASPGSRHLNSFTI